MEPTCTVNPSKVEIIFRDIDFVKDHDKILELYVKAFEDQQQYINVSLASGQEHRDALYAIFDIRLSLVEKLTQQGAFMQVATKDGTIVGAGGIAPNTCKSTTWDLVVSGVLLLPFKLGYAAFARAMKLGDSTADSKVDPDGGKVMMMAVLPDLHGQGVGRSILKNLLQKWDDRGDLVLSTQLESCVKFYSNLGFTLTAEVKKNGYSNWSMIRRKALNSDAQPTSDVHTLPTSVATGPSDT